MSPNCQFVWLTQFDQVVSKLKVKLDKYCHSVISTNMSNFVITLNLDDRDYNDTILSKLRGKSSNNLGDYCKCNESLGKV